MKAYLLVTGLLFVAITAAHVLRIVAEGAAVAKQPLFLAMTLVAVAMAAWQPCYCAGRLVEWRSSPSLDRP